MKILLLFPHFNTPKQASSLRSLQIGRALATAGHTVVALAPDVDMRTGRRLTAGSRWLYAVEDVEGVRVVRPRTVESFRKNPLSRLAFEVVFAVLSAWYALREPDLDLIVCAYPPALLPPLGAVVAGIRGVPMVYEVRDLMADALRASGYIRSGAVHRIGRWAEEFTARHAAALVTVSGGILDAFRERGMVRPDMPVAVVPQGVEPRLFEDPPEPPDGAGLPHYGDKVRVVYAGALTSITDFALLVRVAERMRHRPEVVFLLFGEGPARQRMEQDIEARALENLVFMGYQERRYMPWILSHCDVAVNFFRDDTTWSYILGNKIFDYLASGIPVLYAGRGDTADLIRSAQAGVVVEPEDDEAFSRELEGMVDDPEGRRRRGASGREYVMTHWNGDARMQELVTFLEGVAVG